jgi:hypothetical protein
MRAGPTDYCEPFAMRARRALRRTLAEEAPLGAASCDLQSDPPRDHLFERMSDQFERVTARKKERGKIERDNSTKWTTQRTDSLQSFKNEMAVLSNTYHVTAIRGQCEKQMVLLDPIDRRD